MTTLRVRHHAAPTLAIRKPAGQIIRLDAYVRLAEFAYAHALAIDEIARAARTIENVESASHEGETLSCRSRS